MDNKKSPLISVLVPVYNAEKYLERSIESIRKQTYTNLEIILVNDGSKDSSGDICDRYARIDARIKVIHKENRGVSDTRNVALKNVTGEMLVFVDADDYINPLFLEKLFYLKEKENAQIAMCGFQRFHNEILMNSNANSKITTYYGADILRNIYGDKGNLLCGVLWNKLYDAKLFEGLAFPIELRNEDEFILPKVLDRVQTLVYTEETLYYYFENDSSITTDNKYLESDYIYRVFDERMSYFSKKGCEYNDIVNATKKAYLDRIIIRYKRSKSKVLLKLYKEKYPLFKDDVKGVGYVIFYISPFIYFQLVKIMKK